MIFYHTPVLLKEAIENLKVQKGKKYIDATVGGGGHTFEILKYGGEVLGIDCDQEAINYVREKIKNNLILVWGNFKDIDEIARLNNFTRVSGVLFDLGVSSHQIDSSERGFSYRYEGPLDMRMDFSGTSGQVKAADLVNGLSKGELYELFTKLGEEHNARAISDNIVRTRGLKPIETTRDLAELVQKSYGLKHISAKKLAEINMRIFQALRIAVNDELNNLREGISNAIKILAKNGRIAIISFHSLEDRIVKNKFKEMGEMGLGQIITKKPITPSDDEIRENSRSKSAKLRVFQLN